MESDFYPLISSVHSDSVPRFPLFTVFAFVVDSSARSLPGSQYERKTLHNWLPLFLLFPVAARKIDTAAQKRDRTKHEPSSWKHFTESDPLMWSIWKLTTRTASDPLLFISKRSSSAVITWKWRWEKDYCLLILQTAVFLKTHISCHDVNVTKYQSAALNLNQ